MAAALTPTRKAARVATVSLGIGGRSVIGVSDTKEQRSVYLSERAGGGGAPSCRVRRR